MDGNNVATNLIRATRREKLSAPVSRDDYVPRPRIDEILELDALVTLVVAPAGFGKTTALAGWQNTAARPVVWLTADVEDSDVAKFASHLVDALVQICPDFGDNTCRELQSGQWTPQSLAQSLGNDMAGLVDRTVLIIDDYQEIQGTDVSALVSEILRVPSPSLRLVVSSRWDPNISLARLRAQGMVQEIRAAELRFSGEECRVFLSAVLGTESDREVVEMLHRRIDGWAAGLRLAGIAFSSVDAQHLPDHLWVNGERHLMNFLMDEVLARQPDLVRQLLVKTSILNRVCSQLADTVVEIPNELGSSEPILARLASAGIFEERRGDGLTWYHAHELFRDLLRHQLSMDLQTEGITRLNRLASDWFADHGYIGDAVNQALQANDSEYAANLIERSRTELLGRDEWQDLDGWIRQLPDSVIQERPLLQLTRLRTSLFRGVLTGGHHEYLEVRSRIDAMAGKLDADMLRRLRAEVGLLDVHRILLSEHDSEHVAAIAERILDDLPHLDGSGRGIVLMAWAEAKFCMGQEEEALNRLRETLAYERDDDGAYFARVLLAQAIIYLRLGRLNRCEQVLRYLSRLAQERKLRLVGAWARWGLGLLAYERNDLDEADACFSGILAEPRDVHYWTLRESMVGLALIANVQKDTELVETTIARLVQFSLERGLMSSLEIADLLQLRLALMNGDGTIVDRLETITSSRAKEHPYFEAPSLTRAKMHLLRSDPADVDVVLTIVADLEQWASRLNERRRLVEILLIKALACHAQGDRGGAVDATVGALELVGDQPYVRTFLDFGFDLRPIMTLVQASDHAPPNLERIIGLLASREQQVRQASQQDANLVAQPREKSSVQVYELLTQREASVLLCIGEHLTNQEIADRLYISPLTVKRHASNIYDKLGVKNRRQAIMKATELGYI